MDNWGEEILTNVPYYDFYDACENYGFDLADFIKDGFDSFIDSTYIKDLIKLRKSYIIRDYVEVRKIAHKFKGSFSYINIKDREYLDQITFQKFV